MNRIEEIIAGLQILNRYPKCDVSAEHDILYAGPSSYPDPKIDTDDKIALKKLGWHYDEEVESWAVFT